MKLTNITLCLLPLLFFTVICCCTTDALAQGNKGEKLEVKNKVAKTEFRKKLVKERPAQLNSKALKARQINKKAVGETPMKKSQRQLKALPKNAKAVKVNSNKLRQATPVKERTQLRTNVPTKRASKSIRSENLKYQRLNKVKPKTMRNNKIQKNNVTIPDASKKAGANRIAKPTAAKGLSTAKNARMKANSKAKRAENAARNSERKLMAARNKIATARAKFEKDKAAGKLPIEEVQKKEDKLKKAEQRLNDLEQMLKEEKKNILKKKSRVAE